MPLMSDYDEYLIAAEQWSTNLSTCLKSTTAPKPLWKMPNSAAPVDTLQKRVAEFPQQALTVACIHWASIHQPRFPEGTIYHLINQHTRKKESLLEQFNMICTTINQMAGDSDFILDCARSLSQHDGQYRVGPRTLRLHLRAYYRRYRMDDEVLPVYYLAELVNSTFNVTTRLSQAVEALLRSNDPYRKAACECAPITHIRLSKSGNFDLTFDTTEHRDQLSDLLHPRSAGQHHRWEHVYAQGYRATPYLRCTQCGAYRRNPTDSLGAYAIRKNPAYIQHKDRQHRLIKVEYRRHDIRERREALWQLPD